MPFALIGFFLAGTGHWSALHWKLLVLVILCMIFARSAAMGFNRWLDRRFDRINPRTSGREIPSGRIPASNALIFVAVCSLLFILTAWLINPLCGALSLAALAVILGYSYTKRFTPLCHLVLGLALGLAPIGAWLAVLGYFAWLPVLFSLLVVCWVSGFDLIYSLQDEPFDRSQHLRSIPEWLGRSNGIRVSRGLHLLALGFLVAAGILGHGGWLYWAGACLFALILVYQHTLVREDDLSRINLRFMTANGLASCAFALFVIADLLTRS